MLVFQRLWSLQTPRQFFSLGTWCAAHVRATHTRPSTNTQSPAANTAGATQPASLLLTLQTQPVTEETNVNSLLAARPASASVWGCVCEMWTENPEKVPIVYLDGHHAAGNANASYAKIYGDMDSKRISDWGKEGRKEGQGGREARREEKRKVWNGKKRSKERKKWLKGGKGEKDKEKERGRRASMQEKTRRKRRNKGRLDWKENKDREITGDDEERKKRMRKPADEHKDKTKDKKENDRRKWRTGLDWMPSKPKRTQTEACRQWAEPTSSPRRWQHHSGLLFKHSSSTAWTNIPLPGNFPGRFQIIQRAEWLKKEVCKKKKRKIERAVRATSTF